LGTRYLAGKEGGRGGTFLQVTAKIPEGGKKKGTFPWLPRRRKGERERSSLHGYRGKE